MLEFVYLIKGVYDLNEWLNCFLTLALALASYLLTRHL